MQMHMTGLVAMGNFLAVRMVMLGIGHLGWD
jgi:hypothetical protein